MATNSQDPEGTGKSLWSSDPCLTELFLQAFPKVARKRFPGIVYEDARRSARVLSPNSHSFLLPHWSYNTIWCPNRPTQHILDTCDVPTTVLGTGEEGMDLSKKNQNNNANDDNWWWWRWWRWYRFTTDQTLCYKHWFNPYTNSMREVMLSPIFYR